MLDPWTEFAGIAEGRPAGIPICAVPWQSGACIQPPEGRAHAHAIPERTPRFRCSGTGCAFVESRSRGGHERCRTNMQWLANVVQNALVHWGYLALIVGLVGEDAGLPLPGETVLMFASFLSQKDHRLSLAIIIPVGIAAAIMGDNCGFWAGRWLGRHLIRFFKAKLKMADDVAVAADLIHRHGGATIFWARYILGLRVVAGPVAGALGMEWKRFFVFNALGACTWVTFIAMVGLAFSNEFNDFLGYFEKGSWAIAGGIFLIGYLLWRREKKEYHEQHPQKQQ